MNKKFSTLLTMGLLMAGSLVSMANADQIDLPIGDPVTKFKSGKTYFVVQDADGNFTSGAFVLGFGKVDDQPTKIDKTATAALVNAAGSWNVAKTPSDNLGEKSYLWTVTEEKDSDDAEFYYTFTNVFTGKTLMLAADKTLVEDYSAGLTGTISKFTLANDASVKYGVGGTVLTIKGAGNAADGLLLEAGAITFKTSSDIGGKFYLCEVAPTSIEASTLNAAAGGAFTLKYDKSTNNPFAGALKAFKVEASNVSGAVDGTYFATSWPASLNGANKNEITELADFKKCTFIAANPQSNYKINNLDIDGGEGFGFVSVKGSMLLTTPGVKEMKKGYILANNAAFTVEQEYGNKTDYQLSLNGARFILKDGETPNTIPGELFIAALNDQQGKYVTTVKEDNANFDSYTKTCTIDAANLLTVDKLLSTDKASVFNIKFLSKNAGDKDATVSEYNKYLGVNEDGFFVQGIDFVGLDAPENQWIIVEADKDDNSFTFQNRDLVGQKFTAQLVKTSKDNVYEVRTVGGDKAFYYAWVDKTSKEYKTANTNAYLNGTTIELTAVTADPAAGFVTDELDNVGLVKFVATSNQQLIANKLYLGAGANASAPLKMHKEVGASYLWTVVKSEVDPYESYNDYVYYNATDKKVETKLNGDTIKVSLFSFKQYGVDNTYLAVNGSAQLKATGNITDSEDAQQFLVKANKNGSYSLIQVDGSATEYRDVVADEDAMTFSINETDATVDNNTNGVSAFYDYASPYILTIEKEEVTPSLKHEPNYVALNASNRGYVAMDSVLFEGIIAPVSSLKSAYTAEELTFRLDTVDTNAIEPAFYISHKRNFMYYAKDSAEFYNDGTASAEGNRNYLLKDSKEEYVKAIFRAATLVASDTLATTVNGKDAAVTVNKTKETLGGLNNFKFNIVQLTKDSEDEYVIKSVNDRFYLFNLNGFLGFTPDAAKALVVNVEQSEAPVANESIDAPSTVSVIAGNGEVTVKGAAGKAVLISSILGQTIANTVLSSDNATINVPAGIVIVAVDGEAAVKAIVK